MDQKRQLARVRRCHHGAQLREVLAVAQVDTAGIQVQLDAGETATVGAPRELADGKLALGRYQGIFFCEFDGPRERKVYVTTLR